MKWKNTINKMSIFKKTQPKKDLSVKSGEKKSESIKNQITAQVEKTIINPQEAMKIKHPWITEKVGHLIDLRKYAFLVDKKINKPQVAKAIESIYGVKVLSVNIINKKGKIKSLGRSKGKVPGHKKAIVTLKEGHKIDVMPT